MYEGIEYDINNPSFGGLGSHKRYGERLQNEGQWWESPEAKRAQQMEIGRNLTKWDTPGHPADTMGGIVRYGFPQGAWSVKDEKGQAMSGKGGLGAGSFMDWIFRDIFKQQLGRQYPDYDWSKAPRPREASPEQKKLPPPNSPEYAEYLNTGILPEKG
jgi:hypothetical protein